MWITCLTVMLTSASFAAGPSSSLRDELRRSREELNALLIKYTDKHPLVVAKRDQIAKLEKSIPVHQLHMQLRIASEDLENLLTKYTEKHPLVVAKREQIAALEKSASLETLPHAGSGSALRRMQYKKAIEQLEDLLTKYTEQHPSVLAKRQQILALQKEIQKSD
jgi:uncharacterized protein involved in exopolysaccharide biosynthesis